MANTSITVNGKYSTPMVRFTKMRLKFYQWLGYTQCEIKDVKSKFLTINGTIYMIIYWVSLKVTK